jgi:hypothetical protein
MNPPALKITIQMKTNCLIENFFNKTSSLKIDKGSSAKPSKREKLRNCGVCTTIIWMMNKKRNRRKKQCSLK